MKAGKLYLFFIKIVKISFFLTSLIFLVSCSIGSPSYTKQFLFELGSKQLKFDVRQSCTYEIGVSFESKGGDDAIKEFFGHAREINMPAKINISLLDNSGKSVFSKVNFGGAVLGYRYGPNPIKLIAGKVYLEPGVYIATLNIKEAQEDFSLFESSFFLSADPKVKCNG